METLGTRQGQKGESIMAETYESLSLKLVGRNKQKKLLARNTHAIRLPGPDGRDGGIAIRLHKTNIMVYWPNGQVDLSSGGWRTSVTRERINRYLPYNWRLGCDEGVWWLQQAEPGRSMRLVFTGGITISAFDISLRGQAFPPPRLFTPDTLKAVRKLKRRIKAYAEYCASKMPIDQPGGGDCWICMMDKEGHRADTDHLESHMKEKYVVPRLVYNAIRKHADAPAVYWAAFKQEGFDKAAKGCLTGVGTRMAQRAIYKWVLAAYGIQVS